MTPSTARQRGPVSSRIIDSAEAWSRTFTEVDSLPAFVPGQIHRCVQMGCGKLLSQIDSVRFDGTTCVRIRTDRDFYVEVIGRSTSAAILLAPWTDRTWRVQGRVLEHGRVAICGPGQDLEFLAGAGVPGYAIFVDAQALEHCASEASLAKLAELSPTGASVSLPSSDFRAFQELLNQLTSGRQGVSGDPSLARSSGERQSDVHLILRKLMILTVNGYEDRRSHAERLAIVRESRELMERHLRTSIKISSLCDHLCVSLRTLFYAFQEVMGISPKAYMRILRLNRVRSELMYRNLPGSSVREVAERWGFRHSGQFASDYRRLFDELPSWTASGARANEPPARDGRKAICVNPNSNIAGHVYID